MNARESKLFFSFYYELSDIVNSFFNLGKPIPNLKVVRKILGSLSERFRPKVTIIKESKVTDLMEIDELVGSIKTYEMTLPNSQGLKSLLSRLLRTKKRKLKLLIT